MTEQTAQAETRLVRRRHIPAPAEAIFTLLTDPQRHRETEPGDWVRDAIDDAPLTGVGQVFSMNMFLDAAGGAYRIDNTVTAYEPLRAIAWDPGQTDDTGTLTPGGWRWRYDLDEGETGTEVTLTYDWSATSEETRQAFGGFPPFPAEFLEESLASLERAVTRAE
ncbi:SRPBCC family protein [Brevibacterium spongiae]|uniref:SRPBCC family protein n=1 Tax=Brevibacterium spongiae TaxID=2909672 RepID=A0ABY5SSK3_9MICO|nr:SRPBCC family protein [Brevibacterium spongiae]UVI37527.1 SRPBCC family protein [Brevibacterium spongiae]